MAHAIAANIDKEISNRPLFDDLGRLDEAGAGEGVGCAEGFLLCAGLSAGQIRSNMMYSKEVSRTKKKDPESHQDGPICSKKENRAPKNVLGLAECSL